VKERKVQMSTRVMFIGMVVTISMLTLGIGTSASNTGDDLLARYEKGDKEFKRVEIAGMIVYFHQRMIDEAIVEKDFIVYQFDQGTKELLNKKTHWRSGLPEHVTLAVAKEKAESMVKGEVQFARLYIISPESDVFPLEPTPQNPCWVVRSIEEERPIVTIIDAIDGRVLGYGIPPPYTGFSLTGPWYFYPCDGSWLSWYASALYWFNTMGYLTEGVEWPIEDKVRGHVQSDSTAMFYELAHGDSYYFASGCLGGNDPEYTSSFEIHDWIADYTKMPFTFLGSCEGMCNLGSGSFSYEFRKGSMLSTVTVGYCHMSEPQCASAWDHSIPWQNAMFSYMNQEYTLKAAFDQAIADYPMCLDCMRFCGDEDFAVVPPVERRGPEFILGDANGDQTIDVADVMYLINYLFISGSPPQPKEAGDANCDGVVDIADVMYLINYLFIGGTLPQSP
jgi:hypothetical protein